MTIGGPDERTWTYQYARSDFMRDTQPAYVLSGTYEIEQDMAVFTGTATYPKAGLDRPKNLDTRFALNFGFIQGQVFFDGFFPGADGTLRWRVWHYRRTGTAWSKSEDRTISVDAKPPDSARWILKAKIEQTRWDEKGTPTRECFEETVTYTRDDDQGTSWRAYNPAPKWLPDWILPVISDGRIHAINFAGHGIGQLRGGFPGRPYEINSRPPQPK